MKVRKSGDLYRVNVKNTHKPCQLGVFVVLLDKLGNSPLESIYWRGLNLSTGKWHHYRITDLEFISEGR